MVCLRSFSRTICYCLGSAVGSDEERAFSDETAAAILARHFRIQFKFCPTGNKVHPELSFRLSPKPVLTLRPRVTPHCQAAIDHYHQEIDGLVSAGIVPMITLLHFTHPLWLEDRGGFEDVSSPQAFLAFSRRMYAEYGGKVRQNWKTRDMGEGMRGARAGRDRRFLVYCIYRFR